MNVRGIALQSGAGTGEGQAGFLPHDLTRMVLPYAAQSARRHPLRPEIVPPESALVLRATSRAIPTFLPETCSLSSSSSTWRAPGPACSPRSLSICTMLRAGITSSFSFPSTFLVLSLTASPSSYRYTPSAPESPYTTDRRFREIRARHARRAETHRARRSASGPFLCALLRHPIGLIRLYA